MCGGTMSDLEQTYCRLCAEPTPTEQLISANEDVALSSKIATKLLWIHIDISASSDLPSTICFSCFDLLERTWAFLHDVRTAQEKLRSIFTRKVSENNEDSTSEIKPDCTEDAGQPVDYDWQDFQESKATVKNEITTSDEQSLLSNLIKTERNSDDNMNSEAFSTDSDEPLKVSAKKKKIKVKKKKIKKVMFDAEVFEADLIKTEAEALPLDITVSWDEYMCRCAQCDALCKNIQALRLHSLQIHSSCCVFKCSKCGKVTANFKSFIRHVRSHKKLCFTCEHCNKEFTYVKRHIRSAHNELCTTMCQNCGATFETDDLLQEHLSLYGKGHKRSRKVENDNIDYHLKCEYCSKEFKSRSNLQQHKLVHTERSRDFACHVCGRMFFTKGTLSTHMMTHEDSKPFKCEFCPMEFRARGNLQSHISLHSGAKPFVCDKCGKSFRVKRHLKSHSIVHTDLMPYICSYCNKQFRFKTRLNLHLRQHTGAKPYTCLFCQRDFTNGSNFKKHMKRRHNIDTSKKRYATNNIVAETIIGSIGKTGTENEINVNSVQTVSDIQV